MCSISCIGFLFWFRWRSDDYFFAYRFKRKFYRFRLGAEKCVQNDIFLGFSKASLYVNLHFSRRRGGSGIQLLPKSVDSQWGLFICWRSHVVLYLFFDIELRYKKNERESSWISLGEMLVKYYTWFCAADSKRLKQQIRN